MVVYFIASMFWILIKKKQKQFKKEKGKQTQKHNTQAKHKSLETKLKQIKYIEKDQNNKQTKYIETNQTYIKNQLILILYCLNMATNLNRHHYTQCNREG